MFKATSDYCYHEKLWKQQIWPWILKIKNAVIFGEQEKLIITKSGHYTPLFSSYSKILINVATGTNPNITPITMFNKSKCDMTVKLHWQFSYPSPEKLLRLLNCAGEQ